MVITITNDFARFLVRLADTELILAQRLCEMCSRGPFLEEDIALSNSALDLLGRAEELYHLLAATEGKGLTPDDYAYHRDEREFFSYKLVEQPNTDFAWVIARQYLHDVYVKGVFTRLLQSDDSNLAGLSEKVLKEIRYSLERSKDWMLRLGIGTEESNGRLQFAIDRLFRFVPELFAFDAVDLRCLPDTDGLIGEWKAEVSETLHTAGIREPELKPTHLRDSREGFHTEHLGHLLSEMQFLPRAYPDATW
jgi:ring-1,2-phenylacetyl-CoA epoxidase subunit PaaC